jgi:hypothetical protein
MKNRIALALRLGIVLIIIQQILFKAACRIPGFRLIAAWYSLLKVSKGPINALVYEVNLPQSPSLIWKCQHEKFPICRLPGVEADPRYVDVLVVDPFELHVLEKGFLCTW